MSNRDNSRTEPQEQAQQDWRSLGDRRTRVLKTDRPAPPDLFSVKGTGCSCCTRLTRSFNN